MANNIYQKEISESCPRCGASVATLMVYHFGATYKAECAKCGLGQATGDSEEIVMARLLGEYLDGGLKWNSENSQ